MGFREVMNLPVRHMWLMNNYIDRLRAETDLRAIEVQRAIQNDEAYKEVTKRLIDERGEPARYSPLAPHKVKRDEEGIEKLKQMTRANKR